MKQKITYEDLQGKEIDESQISENSIFTKKYFQNEVFKKSEEIENDKIQSVLYILDDYESVDDILNDYHFVDGNIVFIKSGKCREAIIHSETTFCQNVKIDEDIRVEGSDGKVLCTKKNDIICKFSQVENGKFFYKFHYEYGNEISKIEYFDSNNSLTQIFKPSQFEKLDLFNKYYLSTAEPIMPPYEKYTVTDGQNIIEIKSDGFSDCIFIEKPVALVWPDCEGSVGEYYAVSKFSNEKQDEFSSRLNHVVNDGNDDEILSAIKDFLQLFSDGEYYIYISISSLKNRSFHFVDDSKNSSLSDFTYSLFPYDKQDYFFTRSYSTINRERVDFYKEKISGGLRPKIIVYADYSFDEPYCHDYIIDGHHKMLAYLELGVNPYCIYISKSTSEKINKFTSDLFLAVRPILNIIEAEHYIENHEISIGETFIMDDAYTNIADKILLYDDYIEYNLIETLVNAYNSDNEELKLWFCKRFAFLMRNSSIGVNSGFSYELLKCKSLDFFVEHLDQETTGFLDEILKNRKYIGGLVLMISNANLSDNESLRKWYSVRSNKIRQNYYIGIGFSLPIKNNEKNNYRWNYIDFPINNISDFRRWERITFGIELFVMPVQNNPVRVKVEQIQDVYYDATIKLHVYKIRFTLRLLVWLLLTLSSVLTFLFAFSLTNIDVNRYTLIVIGTIISEICFIGFSYNLFLNYDSNTEINPSDAEGMGFGLSIIAFLLLFGFSIGPVFDIRINNELKTNGQIAVATFQGGRSFVYYNTKSGYVEARNYKGNATCFDGCKTAMIVYSAKYPYLYRFLTKKEDFEKYNKVYPRELSFVECMGLLKFADISSVKIELTGVNKYWSVQENDSSFIFYNNESKQILEMNRDISELRFLVPVSQNFESSLGLYSMDYTNAEKYSEQLIQMGFSRKETHKGAQFENDSFEVSLRNLISKNMYFGGQKESVNYSEFVIKMKRR